MTEEDLLKKARRIKLLLLDVDGVLTDGRIVYDSKGRDSKFFDVHDGLGVYMLRIAGIHTILITAKGSHTIKPRARDMGVDRVYSDVYPKSAILDKVSRIYKVSYEEICFVGDDLVDLGIMQRVGFSVAVFNACAEIKDIADYITKSEGGRGAVREVAELLLKSQERWDTVLQRYRS